MMPRVDLYTKVLLHMNGADASTTFTDETGRTWTRYGDSQIDTAEYKFGGASGLFDGTGDYLSAANSADFDFGTGDWTIDFWVRRNGVSAYRGVIGAASESGVGWCLGMSQYLDGKIELTSKASGVWKVDLTMSEASVNTEWAHIAVVRDGNWVNAYLNGVNKATKEITGYTYNSAGIGASIGRLYPDANNYYWVGHIDEMRISKGIARWTANFTPPTREYRCGGLFTFHG
jgi:hypothetical protein